MKLQNPFILEYDKNRFYCFQGAIMSNESNDFLRVTLQPTIPSLSISLLSVIFLQVFLNPQSSPLKKFKNKEKTWNLESTDHKLDNERSNGADSPRNGFPGKKKRASFPLFIALKPFRIWGLSPSFFFDLIVSGSSISLWFELLRRLRFCRKRWARVRVCTLRSARRLEVFLHFSIWMFLLCVECGDFLLWNLEIGDFFIWIFLFVCLFFFWFQIFCTRTTRVTTNWRSRAALLPELWVSRFLFGLFEPV